MAGEATTHAIDSSLFLNPGIDLVKTHHEDLLIERHMYAIEVFRSLPYHFPTAFHGCGVCMSLYFPY